MFAGLRTNARAPPAIASLARVGESDVLSRTTSASGAISLMRGSYSTPLGPGMFWSSRM